MPVLSHHRATSVRLRAPVSGVANFRTALVQLSFNTQYSIPIQAQPRLGPKLHVPHVMVRYLPPVARAGLSKSLSKCGFDSVTYCFLGWRLIQYTDCFDKLRSIAFPSFADKTIIALAL